MTDLRLETLHDRLAAIIAAPLLAQAWPIVAEHVSAAMCRGAELGAGAPNPHHRNAQRLLAAAELGGHLDPAALVEAVLSLAYEMRGISVTEAIDRGIFDVDDDMRDAVRRRLIDREDRS